MPFPVRNWMSTPVLLLNASYEALTHVPADRAVTLLVTGVAETVIEAQPHVPIRSQHTEVVLPESIRLLRYVYVRFEAVVGDHSHASAVGVLRRDGHICGYCGAPNATTVDHVLPKSRRGPSTWANLIAACVPCNGRKADRTPAEAGLRLRWEPKAPNHIAAAQRKVWKQLTY